MGYSTPRTSKEDNKEDNMKKYIVVIKKGMALPPKNQKEFEAQQADPTKVKKADIYVAKQEKESELFIGLTGAEQKAELFDTKEAAIAIAEYIKAIKPEQDETEIVVATYNTTIREVK